MHSLEDTQFPGMVFEDLTASLPPGESLSPIVDIVIYNTIVNTATWTAYSSGSSDYVSATDTARVIVPPFRQYIPFAVRP
jgi:hypothetical protein